MPEQIYIGNFSKGLVENRVPFVINNDSFPTLFNMYAWRGRAKRKRGTVPLGQLTIETQVNGSPNQYQLPSKTLDGSGHINLISAYTLPATTTIVPGSIHLTVNGTAYTDNSLGFLVGGSGGIINYATTDITFTGQGGQTMTGTASVVSFAYYPGNPVMGLRDRVSSTSENNPIPITSLLYPQTIAFDTTNAYAITTTGVPSFYNVTYYKNSKVPFVWSGLDYQQFYTTNYTNAFWATNGKPGLHMVTGTYVSGSGSTTIHITISGTGAPTLVVNDVLWFNEWGNNTINGKTGIVTTVGADYTVTFTASVTASGTGKVQLLTNSVAGQDGIKWYDGDPTGQTGIPTTNSVGWVNFAPPLTASTVSIDTDTAALYYLVGATAIVPFKNRLLMLAPIISTSAGIKYTLYDAIIWSQVGTPYYTVDASGVPILVPTGETAALNAWYVDQSGLGDWASAGISQPITTVGFNEDVLMVGFGGSRGRKTRFVYTGNDLQPFAFFSINTELPSDATFSLVNLDKGVLEIGAYGITMTDQQSSQRVDIEIPDEIFDIQNANNGFQRVNAVRNFQQEWVYFTYPPGYSQWKYPTQTFLFNYRDYTWAILYENWTAHGNYRAVSGYTWDTLPYKSWEEWTDPWEAGITVALYPQTVAGNPQGFVLQIGEGTGEAPSGTISAIATADSGFATTITSTNHCVSAANPFTYDGDFLYFSGFITSSITAITNANPAVITTNNFFSSGNLVTISGVMGMTQLNGNTYTVTVASSTSITINVDSTLFGAYTSGGTVSPAVNGEIGKVIKTADANTFTVDIAFANFPGTYMGNGQYTRLAQPYIQTKQFNPYWEQGRQVRLSAQKYIFDATGGGQITVDIALSQDPDNAWNSNKSNPPPNSLVYSQLLYTCPESTNIGLTPANTNLQMPTALSQNQIWHRFNTSLIGDTFQIGFTLSSQETKPDLKDAQMYNLTYATSEITLHGMQLSCDKGPHLA